MADTISSAVLRCIGAACVVPGSLVAATASAQTAPDQYALMSLVGDELTTAAAGPASSRPSFISPSA